MQDDVPTSAEKLALLAVIDKLVHVSDVDQFMDWIDFDLKPVFPHETFICGIADIREKPAVVRRLVYRNFPFEFFDYFRQQSGLIFVPCMGRWTRDGEPQLFDPDHKADVDTASVQQFRRFNLRNIASHGTKSIDGDDTSYFSFVNMPGKLGPRHAYVLKFLVPHMHSALLRIIGVGSPTNAHDIAVAPAVTAREQEVLHWMACGKSNGEIAQILGTSPNTVKNQVRKILVKLQVNNRTQAASVAAKMRVPLPEGPV